MVVDSGRIREEEKAAARKDSASDAGILDEVQERLAVLGREVKNLVDVKIAKARLSVARGLFKAAGFVLAAVFASAFLATAVVLLFSGIAGWISEASGRPWLGPLVTGGAGIAAIVTAFVVTRNVIRRKVAKKACDER